MIRQFALILYVFGARKAHIDRRGVGEMRWKEEKIFRPSGKGMELVLLGMEGRQRSLSHLLTVGC